MSSWLENWTWILRDQEMTFESYAIMLVSLITMDLGKHEKKLCTQVIKTDILIYCQLSMLQVHMLRGWILLMTAGPMS